MRRIASDSPPIDATAPLLLCCRDLYHCACSRTNADRRSFEASTRIDSDQMSPYGRWTREMERSTIRSGFVASSWESRRFIQASVSRPHDEANRARTREQSWSLASREAASNASFSERHGEVDRPTTHRLLPVELANAAKSSTHA